jgi:ligand-binding SRPBCC domain-containing protein
LRNPEQILRTVVRLEAPWSAVFDFFADAENLERITPPELNFRIVTPRPIVMGPGAIIDYRLSLYRLPFSWRTEITEWDPPFGFVDTQVRGPYAQWIHRHTFREDGRGTVMEDEVRYRLPVPGLGELARPLVRLELRRIFDYREARIRELLADGSASLR